MDSSDDALLKDESQSHDETVQARYPELDRLKGLLIALIVLGHNHLFSEAAPKAFNIMYVFHVASFLLIPFLYQTRDFSWDRLNDKFARYLVPHFLFFGIACIAYFIVFVPKQANEILDWLVSVILAVVFSSESTYNEASGFRLFWFLPTLLALALIRGVYVSGGAFTRYGILSLSTCVHFALGLVPQHFLAYVPWGLPIILFIFPLGLVAESIWRRFRNDLFFFYISGVVFAACIGIAWNLSGLPALAGEPRVYSILQPEWLLFQDVFLVSAFFALCGVAMLLPDTFFRKLGLASLFVFLTHGFVWQSLIRTGFVDWMESRIGWPVLAVVVTYASTMVICLLLHDLLKRRESLWSFLFPRNASTWRLPGVGRG